MSRLNSLIFLMATALACVGLTASAAVVDASPSRQSPNTDVAQIRSIIETESKKAGTQGVLFGMWVGERPVLITSLGQSMTTVPASPDMHWRIGGIAETFVGTLVMMLSEQGKINLDEKISRWVPDLLSADKVTMRMLISNTAGYIDYVPTADFEKLVTAEPFRTFTPDELIAYSVKGGKMNYPPGTSQRYSHTEFIILCKVLERATGQTMKALFEQNIFSRAGLKNTLFPTGQEIPDPVLHAFSLDRGPYEDATYFNPSWGGGNGMPISTIADVGRWGRIFGTGALISPASFKTMTAPTSAGKGHNTDKIYFAYGFAVTNGWFVQNPSINGYSGGFGYNPATDVTIVVASTRGPAPSVSAGAFPILQAVSRYVTPSTPITF